MLMKYFCRYLVIEFNKSGHDACHLHVLACARISRQNNWQKQQHPQQQRYLRGNKSNLKQEKERKMANQRFGCAHAVSSILVSFISFAVIQFFLWFFCLIYIRTQFIMFGTAFYRNFSTQLKKKTKELWLKVSSQQWLYNKRLCTAL